MQTEDLIQLIHQTARMKTEGQTLEVKAAAAGCPERLYDTLSAFSNQDDGGVILFGVDERNGFVPCGVYDANDLQHRVTEQCKEMEPPIRALFSVAEKDGKVFVSAEIPGAPFADRPVFYKGKGRLRGSFVREGESDEPMTEYEVYSFEAFRQRTQDDRRMVDGMPADIFDRERLASWLDGVKRERPNLSRNVSDETILELMGVTSGGKPTLAGILVFSLYPQARFPQLGVTAVALPGTEMGELGAGGLRFLDSTRLSGSVQEMVDGAVDFVARNGRVRTAFGPDGRRTDLPEYPPLAVREAVLNALVHRDYGVRAESSPVRLEMFRDRLEISNEGAPYGGVPVSALGEARPETRNPVLATLLEKLHVVENRYSGIPTIRRECRAAGLPPPEFSVRHGVFRVVFRNGTATATADSARAKRIPSAELESALLAFCAEPRTRSEVISFVGRSPNYVMSYLVRPLLESDRLLRTDPAHPKRADQRFVAVPPK